MLNTRQHICCRYRATVTIGAEKNILIYYAYTSIFFILKSTPDSESTNKMSYVSSGATVAVLVFDFCCSLLFQALVKTGLVAD